MTASYIGSPYPVPYPSPPQRPPRRNYAKVVALVMIALAVVASVIAALLWVHQVPVPHAATISSAQPTASSAYEYSEAELQYLDAMRNLGLTHDFDSDYRYVATARQVCQNLSQGSTMSREIWVLEANGWAPMPAHAVVNEAWSILCRS